jgi:putative ABC transport system substrate-binding protein
MQFDQLKRREFITLLGGAAAAWPLAARGQEAVPVVGYLVSGTPEGSVDTVAGFRRGLSEAGFVEDRNVAVEYRWGYDDPTRMVESAADLVRRRVTVIAASTAGAALRAKAATATIPIVFVAAADAIEVGLVSNPARPDGNLTGINSMSGELGAKRLGLLHQLLPRSQRLGVLVSPNVPGIRSDTSIAQAAAIAMGASLEILSAGTNAEIDAAFARAAERRVDALMVAPAQLFLGRHVQLTAHTIRHALAAMFFDRRFVDGGGLMSYSASWVDLHRQAGIYTGRILRGEKPADLPVMQPTKFEFVINMQTARTIGIEVPADLIAIADEVIE